MIYQDSVGSIPRTASPHVYGAHIFQRFTACERLPLSASSNDGFNNCRSFHATSSEAKATEGGSGEVCHGYVQGLRGQALLALGLEHSL